MFFGLPVCAGRRPREDLQACFEQVETILREDTVVAKRFAFGDTYVETLGALPLPHPLVSSRAPKADLSHPFIARSFASPLLKGPNGLSVLSLTKECPRDIPVHPLGKV